MNPKFKIGDKIIITDSFYDSERVYREMIGTVVELPIYGKLSHKYVVDFGIIRLRIHESSLSLLPLPMDVLRDIITK